MNSEIPNKTDNCLKLLKDKNDHSLCNPDSNIHNGIYQNQLGCIHNNPNIDNTIYIWSLKNKQWKKIRYWNNHNYCKINKHCVFWNDELSFLSFENEKFNCNKNILTT
jgi:hypothetical protein